MPILTSPAIDELLIWSDEDLQFFANNKNVNPERLLLQSKPEELSHKKKLVHQLQCLQKASEKLPHLVANTQIVFPAGISLEQCSSEITAKYKASLFSGKTFMDLSTGFGVDSYYLSQRFERGILIERNEALGKIIAHNFAILQQNNVQFILGRNAEDVLQKWHKPFAVIGVITNNLVAVGDNTNNGMEDVIPKWQEPIDLIYIDPARRNQAGAKIFMLKDCEPDIVSLQSLLLEKCKTILVKTSPLLDITLACQELQHVKNIYVVAVNNECRELLIEIEKDFIQEPQIHAVNLIKNAMQAYAFYGSEEKNMMPHIASCQQFLYEPNAAIIKAGAYKKIAFDFGLQKLHTHTHLYTSNELVSNFPGRRFEVLAQIDANKKEVQKIIPEGKATLSIRNFPSSVAELKKKLGLQDGGEYYVFGTTFYNDKKGLLVTRKMD